MPLTRIKHPEKAGDTFMWVIYTVVSITDCAAIVRGLVRK
jgi:hypothetical protein